MKKVPMSVRLEDDPDKVIRTIAAAVGPDTFRRAAGAQAALDDADEKWLRHAIKETASRALGGDELSTEERAIVSSAIEEFECILDRVAGGDKRVALGLAEAAFTIAAIARPVGDIKKELRARQTQKARQANQEQRAEGRAALEDAIIAIASRRGWAVDDLKAGDKWVETHLLRDLEAMLGARPLASSVAKAISRLKKKERISD